MGLVIGGLVGVFAAAHDWLLKWHLGAVGIVTLLVLLSALPGVPGVTGKGRQMLVGAAILLCLYCATRV